MNDCFGFARRAGAFGEQFFDLRNHDRVDDLRAGGLQFADRFVENFLNFFEVFRVRFGVETDGLAQDAEARAFETVFIQKLGEACREYGRRRGR